MGCNSLLHSIHVQTLYVFIVGGLQSGAALDLTPPAAYCSASSCEALSNPVVGGSNRWLATAYDEKVCGERDDPPLGSCFLLSESGYGNWSAASLVCTSVGARLCRLDDFSNGVGIGSGCSQGGKYHWMWDSCSSCPNPPCNLMARKPQLSSPTLTACYDASFGGDSTFGYLQCCADFEGTCFSPSSPPTSSPSSASWPNTQAPTVLPSSLHPNNSGDSQQSDRKPSLVFPLVATLSAVAVVVLICVAVFFLVARAKALNSTKQEEHVTADATWFAAAFDSGGGRSSESSSESNINWNSSGGIYNLDGDIEIQRASVSTASTGGNVLVEDDARLKGIPVAEEIVDDVGFGARPSINSQHQKTGGEGGGGGGVSRKLHPEQENQHNEDDSRTSMGSVCSEDTTPKSLQLTKKKSQRTLSVTQGKSAPHTFPEDQENVADNNNLATSPLHGKNPRASFRSGRRLSTRRSDISDLTDDDFQDCKDNDEG